MTTHERIEEQIATMLARRADEVPADLAVPPIADLGLQRLVRGDAGHVPRSRRKEIMISAAAVLAVISGIAIAVRMTDDRPTAVIGIAPSTTPTTKTVVDPPPSSVATAPPAPLPSFDTVARAPSLAPGQACPTTPITTPSPSMPIRVGQGQVAILPYPIKPRTDDVTIAARQYGDTGEIPVFWFAAPEVGSILVRGYQLDGDDVMRFNSGPNLIPSLWILFSQGWSTFGMPQGWVHEPDIWLFVNNSGCYAIDILGARGYSDRLIIKVART
jgi:hypothetical protein